VQDVEDDEEEVDVDVDVDVEVEVEDFDDVVVEDFDDEVEDFDPVVEDDEVETRPVVEVEVETALDFPVVAGVGVGDTEFL